MNNGKNCHKRKKAEQIELTCSAFRILKLFNFSAIIFPVDFRENCATIATTKRKNEGTLSKRISCLLVLLMI